ncbi:MAG: hypothetical protein M0T80_01500 [Actinomycetota bacterium]|nr:hypothetical protein [Actinomycetota bacterium]
MSTRILPAVSSTTVHPGCAVGRAVVVGAGVVVVGAGVVVVVPAGRGDLVLVGDPDDERCVVADPGGLGAERAAVPHPEASRARALAAASVVAASRLPERPAPGRRCFSWPTGSLLSRARPLRG